MRQRLREQRLECARPQHSIRLAWLSAQTRWQTCARCRVTPLRSSLSPSWSPRLIAMACCGPSAMSSAGRSDGDEKRRLCDRECCKSVRAETQLRLLLDGPVLRQGLSFDEHDTGDRSDRCAKFASLMDQSDSTLIALALHIPTWACLVSPPVPRVTELVVSCGAAKMQINGAPRPRTSHVPLQGRIAATMHGTVHRRTRIQATSNSTRIPSRRLSTSMIHST